jgi:hypothetical protein
MDYFIADGIERNAGESFTVKSDDVGGLFNFGDEMSATGTIDLKQQSAGGGLEESAVLAILGGEIEIEAPEEGVEQRVHLEPIAGTVEYSAKSRMVTYARATWNAGALWATTDHLLFGTTNVHDLTIETLYEAGLVSVDDPVGAE